MKLVRREPGVGYLDTWLWLPKKYVSEAQIRASLTYLGKDNELIEGWREEPHHYRVPRNYFLTQNLAQLPFKVKDARHQKFPKASFTSRITLDGRDPSKDYQRKGSAALLDCYDGILCLRCGAGKTVVGLHAAAQLGVPILIIVSDKGLARQWMEEIENVLGVKEKDVGRIGGDGSPFDWEKDICIGIVNSIAIRAKENRLPHKMTRHFGVVIGDEAHVLGAPFFNLAIPPFHGRRWGLSATPTREDGLDSLLRYTMGEVRYSYLMPEIKPKVIFKRLPTQPNFSDPTVREETHDVTGELHYGKLYNHFGTSCPDRMNAIAEEIKKAVKSGRQCLVLSHSRATVETLHRLIPGSGECHGGVGENDRLHRIRTTNPVIAIMKLGKQALNKPSLDTLFVCDPFRKAGMLQQVMGRVQRDFHGKKESLVIFFEDHKVSKLYKMCGRIRATLNRWPKHKGGRIEYVIKGC